MIADDEVTGLEEPVLACFLIQHRLFHGGATAVTAVRPSLPSLP